MSSKAKKLFKASDETRVWKIRKKYSRSKEFNDFWVRFSITFSLKSGELHQNISDDIGISYNERSNTYNYTEYLCLTPSTEGIIRELEALQNGIKYQMTSTEDTLIILISSLDNFWH